MRWLITAIVALAMLVRPDDGSAQQLLYAADQWGEINIKARQSSAGDIESVLATNANFERLATYAPTSRLRRLSRPVGRLDIRFARTGEWTTCTATLIAVDEIVTNHHCVPNIDRLIVANGPVDVVTLVMGYYDETDEAAVRKYEVDPTPIRDDAAHDVSFLRVRGTPGREWGWATLSPRDPKPGEGLFVIHHPGGSPKHVTRGRCRAASPRATDQDGVDLYHYCDTLPGSSGAPIFSDEDNTVIAFHRAGGEQGRPGSVNYGVLVSALSHDGANNLSPRGSPEGVSQLQQDDPCLGYYEGLVVTLRQTPATVSLIKLQKMIELYGFTGTVELGPENTWRHFGTFENAFVKQGKSVVDCATQLMWDRETSGPYTPREAVTYVEQLNRDKYLGFDNWRVPTSEELASLTQSRGEEVSFFATGTLNYLDSAFSQNHYFCQSSDYVRDTQYGWYGVLLITWANAGYWGNMSVDTKYPVKAVRTIER